VSPEGYAALIERVSVGLWLAFTLGVVAGVCIGVIVTKVTAP